MSPTSIRKKYVAGIPRVRAVSDATSPRKSPMHTRKKHISGTPRGRSGSDAESPRSPRTSSVPLGERRELVHVGIRERLRTGEFGVVEKIIKTAMRAGQTTAVICRLHAERDYQWQGIKGKTNSPQRPGITALDREDIELHNGCYWELKESWSHLTQWIKMQGLEWDMSFVVMGVNILRAPVEATWADLVVSWPPYTSSERGRVRGPLLTFWEDVCIRKTVQVEDGSGKWKILIKNAMEAGQSSAVIATLYRGADFELIKEENINGHDPELLCVHGARVWISNARLPDGAIGPKSMWILDPRYSALVQWVTLEKLNWYLVFDVEVDPTNPESRVKAETKRLRALFAQHAGDSGVIKLDECERFVMEAAAVNVTPMKYRLSIWAYLVITDYPIKQLGNISY